MLLEFVSGCATCQSIVAKIEKFLYEEKVDAYREQFMKNVCEDLLLTQQDKVSINIQYSSNLTYREKKLIFSTFF